MEAGDLIKDRYRLTGWLGSGGMGQVWAAEDLERGQEVAVKGIQTTGSGAKHALLTKRLRREAMAVGRLTHPGVPRIHDHGEQDGHYHLVMELVSGPGLDEFLGLHQPLPATAAAALAAQICSVLAAAHAVQLVHRDLKPNNVKVGDGGVVKVLDFGLTAVLDPEVTPLTAEGQPLGTAGYMAPEQQNAETVTARTDLFALGCVLHELLTGEPAFRRSRFGQQDEAPVPVRRFRPDVDMRLERLVLDLLAKDPPDRPEDAEEVHTRLEPFLPRPGDPAPQPNLRPDPTMPFRHPTTTRPREAADRPRDRRASARPTKQWISRDEVRKAATDAVTLLEHGNPAEAAALLADVLQRAKPELGLRDPDVLTLRFHHAEALLNAGNRQMGLHEFLQLVSDLICARGYGPDHWLTQRAQQRIDEARKAYPGTA